MSYDTAITVFAPNGNLYQVEYAMEAVKKGLCSVAVTGKDCIVFGVERKSTTSLQEPRTFRKVLLLDSHCCMGFSGLNADARILANIARVQCQSYSLNYDDQVPIEYIAKYVSEVQQKFTQKGGARPFGISTLIAGFDAQKRPRLFQTDPSGSNTEWKANALGRNAKQVIEFLEKNYKEGLSLEECLKIVVKALKDIVESGVKNIELYCMTEQGYKIVSEQDIETIAANLNVEA